MNNSNKNLKQDFHIITNMKTYFQNNIGLIKQHFEEETQLEISSNSDYILLPDLKSMIFNLADNQRNDFDLLSSNQSMLFASSTDASTKKLSLISESLSNNTFSWNPTIEEF
ncbi:unnamed protein product [Paramecium sonneborni]|uniref:Uncharacterized protein n=1 Tax=Paramecium sonneborni TaxID=65129 RepID=A0A8S1PQU0_9CILI|nr:unnamed protein product [Paramecium sonneborni]